MGKTCCGFGHRYKYTDLSGLIYNTVEEAIENGYTEFLTGNMGYFDRAFAGADAVRRKASNQSCFLSTLV